MLHTHKAHFYRLKQIVAIFAKIHFFHHPILRACSTSYAHMRHKWYLWNKTLYIYIKTFYVIIVERRERPDIFGPISCIGGGVTNGQKWPFLAKRVCTSLRCWVIVGSNARRILVLWIVSVVIVLWRKKKFFFSRARKKPNFTHKNGVLTPKKIKIWPNFTIWGFYLLFFVVATN